MRDPADSDLAVRILDVLQYWPPDRLSDFKFDRLATFDVDHLLMSLKSQITARCRVGPVFIAGTQDHRIGVVAIAVGKAPCDSGIAACDDEWRAWQRHTGRIARIIANEH